MALDWNSLPDPTIADATAMFPSLEQAHGLPGGTLAGVMQTESSGNPNVPVGKAGDTGLFQFTPGAAQDYNVNPNDPVSSAIGAAKYIGNNLQKSGGDIRKALVGYNAGPGNMNQADQSYADKVQSNMPKQNLDWDLLPDAPNTTSSLNWDSLPDAPNPDSASDHSGLADSIGSTANSIGGGLSILPGAKQLGAGIASVVNGTPYSQEIAVANANQNAAKQANPITYGATDIAANTVPYLATGGLGLGARMTANAAIGGSEALEHGESPTTAGIMAGVAGPGAEFVNAGIPMLTKWAGNAASNVGKEFGIGGSGHLSEALTDFIKNSTVSKGPSVAAPAVESFDDPAVTNTPVSNFFKNTFGTHSTVEEDYINGVKNLAGGAVLGGVGGVVSALSPVVGGVVATAGAAKTIGGGLQLLGGTVKGLTYITQGTPYAQIFSNIYNDNSLDDDQKEQAATTRDFILQQNDPEYRKLRTGLW